VNAVYLYDDKIVLTFNYKDDAKTITMAEIEASLGSDITASSALLAEGDTVYRCCPPFLFVRICSDIKGRSAV